MKFLKKEMQITNQNNVNSDSNKSNPSHRIKSLFKQN